MTQSIWISTGLILEVYLNVNTATAEKDHDTDMQSINNNIYDNVRIHLCWANLRSQCATYHTTMFKPHNLKHPSNAHASVNTS